MSDGLTGCILSRMLIRALRMTGDVSGILSNEDLVSRSTEQ